MRRDFRHRAVVLGKVVDEDRVGGLIFIQDGLQRRALGSLIGKNPRLDPDIAQLIGSGELAVVTQIGQDHHIGMLAQPFDPLHRADNRLLAVHFGIEKEIEQAPDIARLNQFSGGAMLERLAEIIASHRKIDAMRLVQPIAKRGDHVQDHFVAIADD